MSEEYKPTEDEILNGTWKGYKISWCELCETASISCHEKECHGSSCNAGGCDKCIPVFQEFHKSKTHIWEYLTEEEKLVYRKCHQLKKFILESLANGETEINWQRLHENGKLSRQDDELFKNELKNSHLWKKFA